MKSIQTTALVLWMFIFIIGAFVLGQILISKDIFDITPIITGDRSKEKSDEEINNEALESGISINKIGQETVRIGLNVALDYFSEYYREYINYIMKNIDKYSEKGIVTINDTLASDYAFYAVSRNIDVDKYKSNYANNIINISEAEINSLVDIMFGKNIDQSFKKDIKYGYDKASRKYSINKLSDHDEYSQELQRIENATSNKVVLTYGCKAKGSSTQNIEIIKMTCVYKGGRYIVTEIQI